jgi:hypothetical protein
VSAAVTETSLMTHEHRAGAEVVPIRERAGGRVIHLPSVVCTSSPSTIAAYASVGDVETDAVFSTSRVAPDDRLAGALDATCPKSVRCRPVYPIRR